MSILLYRLIVSAVKPIKPPIKITLLKHQGFGSYFIVVVSNRLSLLVKTIFLSVLSLTNVAGVVQY